jgi:hypothetical protein
MALVVKDRVQETSTTTGTGSLTLAGAVTGFQTFSSAIGNTNTTYYTIQNGAEWEVGVGTVSAGALSRDAVLESSNGGSLVNFSAGTKFVFCTYPAEKSVYYDASNNVNIDITGNAATVTNGLYTTNIGTTVQAYDADTTKNDVANTFTENQTLQKNLIFTGTGNRITGDFSNATIANRVLFQTSTTNGNTRLGLLPNGTATTTSQTFFNATDPANAGFLAFVASSTEATITSGITGTGTYLPMTFYTGNSERMRIDTSGNVGIGTSSPSAILNIYRTGSTLRPILEGTTNQVDWSIKNTSGQLYVGIDGSSGGTTGVAYGAYIYNSSNTPLTFHTNATERMRITSDGSLQFNSGYGSVATAYGCRAWINFNGTGTIAIRNSGGVTSIADNGTGLYTVNLSFTMPDVNYAITLTGGNGLNTETVASVKDNPTTSSFAIRTATDAGTASDRLYVYAALFR